MEALAAGDVFLFEGFRLDRRGGGLFRRDERGDFVPMAIGSRALDVLGVLVERPGDLVSRDALIAAVWPATVAPAGVSHMVVSGIPADVRGFAEGELSKPSDKFVGGKSTMNQAVYWGPGTPPNTDWHHYTWTIIATDLDPKALQPGMTREELAAALKDHVKGSAGLVTRFRHPT